MSKISIDRAVVEQALEALNASRPVDEQDDDYLEQLWSANLASRRALRAALEQPQVEQPVAWCHLQYNDDGTFFADCLQHYPDAYGDTPLFIHPQPHHQLPLTCEAIDAIIKSNFVSINDQNLYDAIYLCMRDVESAHDIEEQT